MFKRIFKGATMLIGGAAAGAGLGFLVYECEAETRMQIKEVPFYVYIEQPVSEPAEEPNISDDDLECLAQNIYHEAKNQSMAGMISVARVTMNRVKDRRYPDTVCEVIQEGPVKESWKTRSDPTLSDDQRVYIPVRHKCQFSWYCDGKSDDIADPEHNRAWLRARDIAYDVLAYNRWNGIVEGATHYHADYVKPSWRHSLTLISTIDNHIFYRWD